MALFLKDDAAYRYFCIIWNTVSIRNQYHAFKKNLKRKKYCMKIFLKI